MKQNIVIMIFLLLRLLANATGTVFQNTNVTTPAGVLNVSVE